MIVFENISQVIFRYNFIIEAEREESSMVLEGLKRIEQTRLFSHIWVISTRKAIKDTLDTYLTRKPFDKLVSAA